MELDFTLKKYKRLIQAIAKSDYVVFTIRDYLQLKEKPAKLILLRHDVDMDPFQQLKCAKMETDYGIFSSYYFRYTDEILKPEVLDEISSLGHEIGYHYETLTKARGDITKAIEIFRRELKYFQKKWNTVTICPHGGATVENINAYSLKDLSKLPFKLLFNTNLFSNWNNREIWGTYSIKDFGLIGDAYLSIDFDNMLYLSDTGRSWSNKYKIKDVVKTSDNLLHYPKVNRTNDVIALINEGAVGHLYILAHAEQWKDNFRDWLKWLMAQQIRRNGKLGLKLYWKITKQNQQSKIKDTI